MKFQATQQHTVATSIMTALRPILRLRRPHIHQYRYLATIGYQSIGSFHSENPEDLLRIPNAAYQPPPLPFDDDSPPTSDDDFMLDKSWTFLNHGAFGASLKCGYYRAQQWRHYLEQQPLRYFDRDLLPHLVYSTRRLAHFMKTSPTNLALLPNVTSGLNTVIQGYTREYKNEAKILLWETSYGSVKKMARTFCDTVHQVSFLSEMMTSEDDPEIVICRALEQYLDNGEEEWSNALLIMDHTASNTALNFPIQELSTIAKKYGMITIVDGAHGLLAQPVHEVLPEVDIYISNGHKWLSCPRGVAVLHCASPKLRETVLRIPAVVSHGIDDGYFNRFAWDGTRDYAAALSLPPVLDYWQWRNPDDVRQQMRTTLEEAVALLSEMWHGTEDCTLASMHMHSPMALVRLPSAINGSSQATSDDAKRIQDCLYQHYIEAPIKCIKGYLYVRLSCHIYNKLSQYERLGQVMLQYKL